MKLVILVAFALFIGALGAIPEHATRTRVPSYPLAVRTPHASIWLNRDSLSGNWPVFWQSKPKGWTGFVRVDGMTYTFLGNPRIPDEDVPLATQTSHAITPTRTYFTLTAGSVDLDVTFFSPVEYSDIMRQSIPLSYVSVDVKSNDGASHEVQVYMDISGEWASSEDSAGITWTPSTTPDGLKVWSTEKEEQIPFREHEEYAQWGQAVIATSGDATHKSGSDVDVRRAFLSSGELDNTHDDNYRCVSCDWPTFGFAHDLMEVSGSAKSVQFVVGHVREDNANFLGEPQKALWTHYWGNTNEMIDFFVKDKETAEMTADALDEKIITDAFNNAGQSYADILSLSTRQSMATNEFSGTPDAPVFYQKEISSGAFMQTVDVIYPAAPMFFYLNVTYLKYILDPLFYQMENQVWTKPFAMHDIGAPYPNALGQAYGGDMPVEESSNMIMMMGDIAFHPDADEAESIAYVQSHWEIMKQWADYLYYNCLYPVNQLSTDDFIGPTELNSGLALKGILGMATFAKLAGLVGDANATEFYTNAVAEFVPIWIEESMHNDGTHLKMEYNVTDGYQFKYNAYHDKLFHLNVVPDEIYQLEADFYLTKLEPYGIPFVNTHDYTKSDWEIWTAGAYGEYNPQLKTEIIEAMGKYLRFTASRVPFSDWYVTATANQVGFQNRPVVGGHFALLCLDMTK